MIADITYRGRNYRIDLSKPIDLSLPLHAGEGQLSAWHVGPVRIEPVRMGDTVYAVKDGAPVNFNNVHFNPHGHGTHTESVGHIAPEVHPVGPLLERYFFTAQVASLRTIERRTAEGVVDQLITLDLLRSVIDEPVPEALVLRTLPNDPGKRTRSWTGTNPPYMDAQAATWLRSIGVQHLLLDLPSVDRERDSGVLAAHHAFWDFPNSTDLRRTITELLFVPDEVRDGRYLLELQVPHFINDAAPSRPVLYALL
ncbi:MAG: cyclase family protein [Flavobacteriales bacterium]|nr:cyclase family protein [Flavobacteriales bacterium]